MNCNHDYTEFINTSVLYTDPVKYEYTRKCKLCNKSDIKIEQGKIETISLEDWCLLRGYDLEEVKKQIEVNDKIFSENNLK